MSDRDEMPDMGLVPMWMCTSSDSFVTSVPSSQFGKSYECTYGPDPESRSERSWKCTCKGFEYRRKCKHLRMAESRRCGWHQQYCGGEAEHTLDEQLKLCPLCHSEALMILVSV